MLNYVFMKEVGYARWALRTALRQFHKRVLSRSHAMRLPTGEWLGLPLSSHFASEAYVSGADVDWGSEKLLAAVMTGRGVFLDVGANIGYYSLYMAPRASAVYSFEPDPRARLHLQQNVSSHSNIHVVPHAVGRAPGEALFKLERSCEVSHLSSEVDGTGDQIKVRVETIDAFVLEEGLTVEAIKIDAEGHDAQVIEGALGVLSAQTPVVLTESEPNAELFGLTDTVGYRVFAYVRHRETRKTTFVELLGGKVAWGDTKMIFLIPPRMADTIEAVARTCSV